MVFASWRAAGRSIPGPLAVAIDALLREPGGARVETTGLSLASWPPGHVERQGVTATARPFPPSSELARSGLPSVRVEGEALVVEAPVLPQYPLYYLRGPEDSYLLVSSRLAPLARLVPGMPLRRERLVCLVQRWAGAVDPDRGATIYAGIRRLLPAERVIADARGIRTDRVLPSVGRAYRKASAKDFAVALREGLDAAVGRAVGGQGRVAVLASGGLDSSGLLATAAARRGRSPHLDVRAVFLQFRAMGDDRPYFEELVAALGVDAHRIVPGEAARWFGPSLCPDGQPGASSSLCLEMLLYSAAAELPAESTLCGSLGDGVLGGPLPFAQLLRRGRVLSALHRAARIRLPWTTTPLGRVRTHLVRPFLPRAILRARLRRAEEAPWMTARFRRTLRECRERRDGALPRLPDTPDEWLRDLCDGDAYALPDVADVGGQVLAETKAAAFDVFMDFELVRLVLGFDPVLLSHGHEYRGLYRLAMKGLLPEAVRTRQDKAYFPPAVASAVLAADGVDVLRDLASLEALAARDLVDPRPFQPLFERWIAAVRRGERDDLDPGDERWEQTWQLLSSEAFLRTHGQGRDLP